MDYYEKLYAPVAIHTLNRYRHLKNCIESLAANELAAKTELYITVDYPPSEKYKEGYEKVKEYLNGGITGFANVNIFFQEENLGAARNSLFIRKKVFEKYDRIIKSEDDNIFSRNFLEYMNYYLDKYESDKSIQAICGYVYPVKLEGQNKEVFRTIQYTAWGYGIWKNRIDERELFSIKDIEKVLLDHKKAKKWKKTCRHIYNEAIYVVAGKHYIPVTYCENNETKLKFPDFMVCIYLYVTGKKVIMPTISKVRNMGHDGSGEHCDDSTNAEFSAQKIDEREHYIPEIEETIEDLPNDDDMLINNYITATTGSCIRADIILMKIKLRTLLKRFIV